MRACARVWDENVQNRHELPQKCVRVDRSRDGWVGVAFALFILCPTSVLLQRLKATLDLQSSPYSSPVPVENGENVSLTCGLAAPAAAVAPALQPTKVDGNGETDDLRFLSTDCDSASEEEEEAKR